MAKFAQVGYGSQGQGAGQDGDGYTYLVNDNVRTGDTISPAVRHYKNGKIFGTTGVVLSSTKTTTPKAQEIREQIENKNMEFARQKASGQGGQYTNDTDKHISIQELVTGKQIGIGRTKGESGKFVGDKSTHDQNGEYIAGKFETATRGANIRLMEQSTGADVSKTQKAQNAVETFDSYSAKFKQGD